MEVTKNFQEFADAIDMNYRDVYDFYQAASGADDSQSTFRVVPANGTIDDTLIIYNSYKDIIALRLSLKAKAYLPEWIESSLM